MNAERTMAVRAMQNMGWTAERHSDKNRPYWTFKRPDTGGLWDSLRVSQAELSMRWVTNAAMAYGDAAPLVDQVAAIKAQWARDRFVGLYQEFGQ